MSEPRKELKELESKQSLANKELKSFHEKIYSGKAVFDPNAYQTLLTDCSSNVLFKSLLDTHTITIPFRPIMASMALSGVTPFIRANMTEEQVQSALFFMGNVINKENLQTWIEKINPLRFGFLLAQLDDDSSVTLLQKNKRIPNAGKKLVQKQLTFLRNFYLDPLKEFNANPTLFISNFTSYIQNMFLSIQKLTIENTEFDIRKLIQLSLKASLYLRQSKDENLEKISNFRAALHLLIGKIYYADYLRDKKNKSNLTDAISFLVHLPDTIFISAEEHLDIGNILYSPSAAKQCPRQVADPIYCHLIALEHFHVAAKNGMSDAQDFLIFVLGKSYEKEIDFKPKLSHFFQESKEIKGQSLLGLDDSTFSFWSQQNENRYQRLITDLKLDRTKEITKHLKKSIATAPESSHQESALIQVNVIKALINTVHKKLAPDALSILTQSFDLLKNELNAMKLQSPLFENVKAEFDHLRDAVDTLFPKEKITESKRHSR